MIRMTEAKENYFDIIIESMINGQFMQMRTQLNRLPIHDVPLFYDHALQYGYTPAQFK